MTSFDTQYKKLIKNILNNGYEDYNRTNDKSKKVFGQVLRFDLSKEFPALTLKKTGTISPIEEMRWIYQIGSNDVRWLQERNIKIWDEWMLEDYSIGESYGKQVKKFDQVNKLINTLKENPQSRRMIIDLWNNADLEKMSLTPCMFLHQADVNNGKLNWHTFIRSSDTALGLPYNVTQVAIMIHMIAQVTNLQVGELMISITNAHLYEQQYEPIKEILNRRAKKAPTIWLNPEIKNFEDFTINDIKILNYKSHPTIKMRVSV